MKQPLNALIVKEAKVPRTPSRSAPASSCRRASPNSYLVTTPGGDVLINTGMYNEAEEIKRRVGLVSSSPLRVIVLTQGHADDVGG